MRCTEEERQESLKLDEPEPVEVGA